LTTTPEKRNDQTFHTGDVITTGAVHAVHDTYTAFLPALLPVFITNLGLTRAEAGMLSVFTQAPSLTQPFIGHLSDRINLNYWVMLAPAISAILMSMLGIISGYFWLAVLLTLAGFSSAMLHAIGPVLTGRFSGRNLGKGMSIWMLGGELGRTLGPIVIVTALAHMGLRHLPWLSLAGIIAGIFLFLRFKDLPGPAPPGSETVHWRRAINKMGPFIIPLTGIITVRAFLISGLTTYLPTFLTDEGESLWLAGASLTILQAAGAAGAYISGSLSDTFGRRTVLFILMVTAPVLTLLFLNTDGWIRLPLLVGLGFSVISTTPVVMAVVQENFPDNRALANGVYMSLSFAIRSAAVLVVGLIGDRFGLGRAIGISGIIMAAGILFIFFLPKSRRVGSI